MKSLLGEHSFYLFSILKLYLFKQGTGSYSAQKKLEDGISHNYVSFKNTTFIELTFIELTFIEFSLVIKEKSVNYKADALA